MKKKKPNPEEGLSKEVKKAYDNGGIQWDDQFGGFVFPDLNGLFHKATEAYEGGRLDEAEHMLKRILGCNDQIPDVHYNLGILYRDRGQFDLSIQHFRRAIELKPDDAAIYCELATALYQNGMKEDAKQNLEQAIRIDQSYALAYANLGVWYLKEVEGPEFELRKSKGPTYIDDCLEKAQKYFEKALNLDPECITARKGLIRIGARRSAFR